ncbi:unnamed protein product [Wuchereria bancrofti]|uniref:Uncharacterized protein n=1 Tax=Wuchereria bancrofti TaxID=6293 RepID=A0A183Y7I8_WUCBA|nr:unnamed protein product [Wuchereria bancrofti]
MSSNNATLNTVIDQVEWIERIIGDFVVSVKDHVSKLAVKGEKTFGSFEDRLTKGSENLNTAAATAYQKCESLPSLITIIVFLIAAGIVVIISLLFLLTKCIHRIVYHHYIRVRGSKIHGQKLICE